MRFMQVQLMGIMKASNFFANTATSKIL